MTELAFKDIVWDYIYRKYGSQAKAADRWNVSPAYVSAITCGKKAPPKWLLREMGYKKEKITTEKFIKIGA